MRQRRLVLVPCPYLGHINPMLQLGCILQSNGFSITIIHTKYNSPNPVDHPNLTFISIPDGLSDYDLLCGDYTALVLALNVNCIAPLERSLSRMMNEKQTNDEELACIIYDELMYFSESVAKRLGLPSIIFRTNNAATFLARGRVIQLIIDGGLPLPDSVLNEQVAGYYPLRFKDLPTNSKFGTSENFLQSVSNLRNIRSSSAVIWNTIECLEKSSLTQIKEETLVPIFAVGPMYKYAPTSSNTTTGLLKEDRSCITWLDKQAHKSVIYVSLGSLATMNASEFAEMFWGLANSMQPFLWVVRPGSVIGSNWIELLPEGHKEAIGARGCIVQWAPQKQVLKHDSVGVFWTHCGWNSTLESICQGIPMICRPNFGDQKVTARYASDVWKVGVYLENELKRGEIERTIRRLMVENEVEEKRQKAEDLKYKVEDCLRECGSSHKSFKELVDFIKSFQNN